MRARSALQPTTRANVYAIGLLNVLSTTHKTGVGRICASPLGGQMPTLQSTEYQATTRANNRQANDATCTRQLFQTIRVCSKVHRRVGATCMTRVSTNQHAPRWTKRACSSTDHSRVHFAVGIVVLLVDRFQRARDHQSTTPQSVHRASVVVQMRALYTECNQGQCSCKCEHHQCNRLQQRLRIGFTVSWMLDHDLTFTVPLRSPESNAS